MKPTILIISDAVYECKYISDMFSPYSRYVDYETNISDINENNYNNYNIIIYDFDNIHDINKEYLLQIINFLCESIKIVITENTEEELMKLLMNLGIDIILPKPISKENVKHSMLIYDFITKKEL
uniref:Response regulatory domain-containing protein n=1 Tax=viral metagenome TaxID=1070528 RepID=A0A6C0E8R7_9ZZZZ